jgi:hypothetical protein
LLITSYTAQGFAKPENLSQISVKKFDRDISIAGFFGLRIFNPVFRKGLRCIIFFVPGYILYKFTQPYFPKGTFDWKDVYGTLIGALFALINFALIHIFRKSQKGSPQVGISSDK